MIRSKNYLLLPVSYYTAAENNDTLFPKYHKLYQDIISVKDFLPGWILKRAKGNSSEHPKKTIIINSIHENPSKHS